MNFDDDGDEVVTLTLHNGDCVEYMKTLATGSVRWVITDPPYGISFMSKKWDNPDKMTSESEVEDDTDTNEEEEVEETVKLDAGPAFEQWNKGWLAEAYRILKPGGTIVSFGACRMYHRLLNAALAVGFENPHLACWTFASGFPKSLNISKACDKMMGQPRPVSGVGEPVDRIALDFGGASGKAKNGLKSDFVVDNESRTEAAKTFEGYGTALKPAVEVIVVAYKPA